MTDLPAPLTPIEADLQDFPFMPLQVARLRDSDLAAEEHPEACWYAVLLWSASWHQIPAGSLPDNDSVLMRLAGLGRDVRTWKKHKAGALRGFVQCDDGRLYHPVVAEQVREAWDGKVRQRHRTFCAAVRKHNERNPQNKLESPSFDEWHALGRPDRVTQSALISSRVTGPNVTRDNDQSHTPVACETPSKRKGQGQGQGDSKEEEANASPSPARDGDLDLGETNEPDPPAAPKPPAKPKRQIGVDHPLPDDWEPDLGPKASEIVSRWPEGMLDREVFAFRSHAVANGRLAKNWDAAFGTWIAKTEERRILNDGRNNRGASAGGYQPRQTAADGFAAATHRRIAEARSRDAAAEAGRADHDDAAGAGDLPFATPGLLR